MAARWVFGETLVAMTNQTEPQVRVVFVGTVGVVHDRKAAATLREERFPPTAAQGPTVAVLDLSGMIPTPGVLQELLVPLAQKIRGGAYGPLVLVVCTTDQAVADVVGYLAKAHDLAMFVTSAPENLRDAHPVGDLTPADLASFETLADLGGQATASQFALRAGLEQTAAGNRLVNLAKKGYIYRTARSRREGDLFIDPRSGVASTS